MLLFLLPYLATQKFCVHQNMRLPLPLVLYEFPMTLNILEELLMAL